MIAGSDGTGGVQAAGRQHGACTGVSQVFSSPRLDRIAAADPGSAALVERLLQIAVRYLPQARTGGDFAFRLDGTRAGDGRWQLAVSGRSLRYAAIAALGLLRLPDRAQRSILDGSSCYGLIGGLVGRLGAMTNLGDAAVTCWAAAEAGRDDLPQALRRLADLDQPGRSSYVVDAAWVVSALVAARTQADVEEHLSRARGRLLAARSAALYPHVIGNGASWYRAHVGSFADQVYPLQALARLHASGDDPEALAVGDSIADTICTAQGEAGQWWWHYDSRTGRVVEGYPVYSVHQHAMAPMALLDLADAGGALHMPAICRGLHWLADPPETAEDLVLDAPGVTWRKVARGDHRKAVRGLRAASTRISPGFRLSVLDRVFPPGDVDRECRPYELGWLLMTWLS
jgi:hypothetical protein